MGPIQFTENNCWLRRRGTAMQILILLVDCSMLVAVDLVSLSKPTLHSRPLKQHSAQSSLRRRFEARRLATSTPDSNLQIRFHPCQDSGTLCMGYTLGHLIFKEKLAKIKTKIQRNSNV